MQLSRQLWLPSRKVAQLHATAPAHLHLRAPAQSLQQQARPQPSSWPSTPPKQQACRLGVVARAAALESVELDELAGPQYMAPEVAEVLDYTVKLAWAAETYDIHSWMILLGLLKNESCVACEILKELGLDDLYGAWHEVLWALNVADGLEPQAFTHKLEWGKRAYAIVQGSLRFAMWGGRDKVETQDLLLAFAASDVLSSLFPDVDLSFERVKHAIEKRTGEKYKLPGYEESALSSQDMFL